MAVIFWRDDHRVRATEDMPNTPLQHRRQGELTDGSGEYVTAQRYGYVWVWYGDPDNASVDLIPHVPHLPIEGMPKRFERSVVFDSTYELLVENLLDQTHADFLHSKLTSDALSDVDVIEVESTSEVVTAIRTAHGRPIPEAQRDLAKAAKTQNIRVVTVAQAAAAFVCCTAISTPGRRSRCCIRATLNRRCAHEVRCRITRNTCQAWAWNYSRGSPISLVAKTTGRCASRTSTTSRVRISATPVRGSTRPGYVSARYTTPWWHARRLGLLLSFGRRSGPRCQRGTRCQPALLTGLTVLRLSCPRPRRIVRSRRHSWVCGR